MINSDYYYLSEYVIINQIVEVDLNFVFNMVLQCDKLLLLSKDSLISVSY